MADEKRTPEPLYWQDLLATLLLSLAAVGTAYSAWQSTRWGSEQAVNFAGASASRVEAIRAFSKANVQMAYDASTFVQLVLTSLQGDQRVARLVGDRFLRKEFRPFAEEWMAQKPLENPNAPANPFELESFHNAQYQEGLRLEEDALRQIEQARGALQHADDYILATVYFSLGLFFGGIATKLRNHRLTTVLLILGGLGSLMGVRSLLILPFH